VAGDPDFIWVEHVALDTARWRPEFQLDRVFGDALEVPSDLTQLLLAATHQTSTGTMEFGLEDREDENLGLCPRVLGAHHDHFVDKVLEGAAVDRSGSLALRSPHVLGRVEVPRRLLSYFLPDLVHKLLEFRVRHDELVG